MIEASKLHIQDMDYSTRMRDTIDEPLSPDVGELTGDSSQPHRQEGINGLDSGLTLMESNPLQLPSNYATYIDDLPISNPDFDSSIFTFPDVLDIDFDNELFQSSCNSNISFFPEEVEPKSCTSLSPTDQEFISHYGNLPGNTQTGILPALLTTTNVQTLQQNLELVPSTQPNVVTTQNDRNIPVDVPPQNRRQRNAGHHPSLPRRRSRYFVRGGDHKVAPVLIPNPIDTLDPMQRWQESPPEDEPASMSALINALNDSSQFLPGSCGSEDSLAAYHDPFISHRRSASLAGSNSETSNSSWQSVASKRSAGSIAAQSRRSQSRIRKRTKEPKLSNPAEQNRPFYCTFCCDRFRHRYDWARHEKSLHLTLEGWKCTPHGIAPISPLTGRKHCAFCRALDPSNEHLRQHNYEECSGGARVFGRKDHLMQHLRLVHHLETMPLVDDWKTEMPIVKSRCGFCNLQMATWDERIQHLSSHFRKGSTMHDWRGDHGFEPSIADKITTALPPYLLGTESKTPIPFSATDFNAKDIFSQISLRADQCGDERIGRPHEPALARSFQQLRTDDAPLPIYPDLLTLHLGRYARQQMSLGVIPTDIMFQEESRRLLYECEDPWNQTFADNPEWLSTFRQNHCGPSNNVGHDESNTS